MSNYSHFYHLLLVLIPSIWLTVGCALESFRIADEDRITSSTSIPSEAPVVLSAIELEFEENDLQIVLTGSRPFTFDFENHTKPLRLTIDVSPAQIEQPENIQVARGGVRSVELRQRSEAEQTARLEIHLDERAFYRLRQDGERLLVGVQLAEPPSRIASANRPNKGAPDSSPLPLNDGAWAEPIDALSQAEKPQPEKKDASQGLLPESQAYRVAPGDELAIKVYGEPELTQTYVVSERGNLTFQFVGAIPITGRTTGEIAEVLKRALSPKYVLNPQVSVDIKKYKTERVFVVGAISPATFTLRNDTTLIEILSQLEGLESNTHVLVYRRVYASDQNSDSARGYHQETIRVDLGRLLRQGDMSLNIVLQPRDVIYVPDTAREGGTGLCGWGDSSPYVPTDERGHVT